VFEQFEWVGHDLYALGMVSSHGGNLSVRLDEERMLITRTGSMIGRLAPADVLETSLVDCGDPRDGDCSVELVVHRAIYAATDARAIVHAHAIHTVTRSFFEDAIVPPFTFTVSLNKAVAHTVHSPGACSTRCSRIPVPASRA